MTDGCQHRVAAPGSTLSNEARVCVAAFDKTSKKTKNKTIVEAEKKLGFVSLTLFDACHLTFPVTVPLME